MAEQESVSNIYDIRRYDKIRRRVDELTPEKKIDLLAKLVPEILIDADPETQLTDEIFNKLESLIYQYTAFVGSPLRLTIGEVLNPNVIPVMYLPVVEYLNSKLQNNIGIRQPNNPITPTFYLEPSSSMTFTTRMIQNTVTFNIQLCVRNSTTERERDFTVPLDAEMFKTETGKFLLINILKTGLNKIALEFSEKILSIIKLQKVILFGELKDKIQLTTARQQYVLKIPDFKIHIEQLGDVETRYGAEDPDGFLYISLKYRSERQSDLRITTPLSITVKNSPSSSQDKQCWVDSSDYDYADESIRHDRINILISRYRALKSIIVAIKSLDNEVTGERTNSLELINKYFHDELSNLIEEYGFFAFHDSTTPDALIFSDYERSEEVEIEDLSSGFSYQVPIAYETLLRYLKVIHFLENINGTALRDDANPYQKLFFLLEQFILKLEQGATGIFIKNRLRDTILPNISTWFEENKALLSLAKIKYQESADEIRDENLRLQNEINLKEAEINDLLNRRQRMILRGVRLVDDVSRQIELLQEAKHELLDTKRALTSSVIVSRHDRFRTGDLTDRELVELILRSKYPHITTTDLLKKMKSISDAIERNR